MERQSVTLAEPKILTVGQDIIKKHVDYKQYVKRSAKESDFSLLIRESLIVKDEKGNPVVVYLEIPDMPSIKMVEVLQSIEYDVNKRSRGLATRSKIFGYMPRDTMRKDYCSSTAMARNMPEAHEYVTGFGRLLTGFYEKYCPEMFKVHEKIANDKIANDWKIHGTPFTSGIINKNNPLKYHFDGGNVSKVYSNMVCFRKDCEGGHLSIPEYDIGLEISNKSILLFDGQSIMHGVTPFHLSTIKAYRYTLVYYTLKAMWSCEPIDKELARIRTRKNERELRRFKRLTGELKPEDDELAKEWEQQYQQNLRLSRQA